jgi:DNA-binding NtrC family response regulator
VVAWSSSFAEAARILGVNRETLRRRLERWRATSPRHSGRAAPEPA